MSTILKCFLILGLVAVIAGSAAAQDQEKKKKKGANKPQAINAALKKVEALDLTDEQKAKIKTIADEFAPKFAEINKKMGAALTAEQKKARADATAKAKADGKKGKELQAAVDAAVGLTDEQKATQKETQAAQKELVGKLNDAIAAVLTPEQKEKFAAKPKKKAAK